MTKNKASTQSISMKLSKIAREESKPYDKVLTIFLLERAIARLVFDPILSQSLIFKGGYVSVRAYGSPRFTTDIDAVLHGVDQKTAIEKIKEQMVAQIDDGVWFHYEKDQNLVTQSEYGGWRITFRSGLGNLPEDVRRGQIVDIDIGTGDPVTPAPNRIKTTSILGNDSLSWQIYPVETILAEKLHTLVVRGSGNSRARDIFDINLLLPQAEPEALRKALKATFTYRGDDLPKQIFGFLAAMDTSLLARGWQNAAGYIASAPRFDAAFALIVAKLKELGI